MPTQQKICRIGIEGGLMRLKKAIFRERGREREKEGEGTGKLDDLLVHQRQSEGVQWAVVDAESPFRFVNIQFRPCLIANWVISFLVLTRSSFG
jgi:hypothetical protein